MIDESLLIVGCGDIGQRVGRILRRRGWRVGAVRRNPVANGPDLEWYAADYTQPGSLAFIESLRPDFVLATFTPMAMDTAGYRRGFAEAAANLLGGLGQHRVKRLIMASSTRVYAETDGGWVDESGPLSTTDPRALAIIEAEQQLLDSNQPTTVVRFGGIYGADGGRLVSRVAGGRIAPTQPVRYTNRIHRDDCAGFLAHLFTRANDGAELAPVYNGVDDEPAPAHEVETWLAAAMGVAATREDRESSVRARSHKRCRNDLLRSSGYELLYPDYKTGYRHVLHME
jgi:nucleoside-diphosphate-sugar epimerase